MEPRTREPEYPVAVAPDSGFLPSTRFAGTRGKRCVPRLNDLAHAWAATYGQFPFSQEVAAVNPQAGEPCGASPARFALWNNSLLDRQES